MAIEQAIRQLRADPCYVQAIWDLYLDSEASEAGARFFCSAEWDETRRLLARGISGGKIMDIGARNSVVSNAFASMGAEDVYAVELDPSDAIGTGALRRLSREKRVTVIEAYAEYRFGRIGGRAGKMPGVASAIRKRWRHPAPPYSFLARKP